VVSDAAAAVPDRARRTRKIWLAILRGGGRWSQAEIEAAAADQDGISLASHVGYLVRSGYLHRYERAGRGHPVRYGVMVGNKVPAGVTLQDLLDAGLVPVEARRAA
jgi:hypothetical protein